MFIKALVKTGKNVMGHMINVELNGFDEILIKNNLISEPLFNSRQLWNGPNLPPALDQSCPGIQ